MTKSCDHLMAQVTLKRVICRTRVRLTILNVSHVQGGKLCSFLEVCGFFVVFLLSLLVAKREPAPGYYDAYSVGHCFEKKKS